ncbi:MAG: DUF4331 domain-containing protein [Chloroflexi bacterium]|nr:DUF4331 domain-containing protein [Chloroflexota bacterium]MCI0579334.1 DUF4331 domain-containing protein [Chloroflexota bacterium]MCI0644977.1 DUF4331 domain-containing protein [Chloroflexota bacterium]MCI0727856.1 DUF4331 domain-containing protein [Chloroflexota bacterium]
MNRNLNWRSAIGRVGLIACLVLTSFALLTAALLLFSPAAASSHREAPLISKDAFADNTDTYVFIPAGQTNRIVLAASWIPFEGPEGGPNYFEWDDTALYDIYVDNDGNATADITYTLNSRVSVANPDTFLYNTGPITSLNDPDWNRKQYYTVTQHLEGGSSVVVVGNVLAPPANIGSKSTPNYQALADAAIYTHQAPAGQIKVFAGQTDDAFWVDLQVFDLLTLRGQAPPVGYANENNVPVDSVSGFNAHSLVLEIPIAHLTQGVEPVLGVWAGTRRSTTNVLDSSGGVGVQVSRLGMPLVNEVVIPMGLKDTFNAIPPSVDLTVYALLQESVEDPEIGNLLCTLYAVPLPGDTGGDCDTEYTPGVPRSGRGDIFDIFLTGMVLANDFTIQTAGGPVTLPAGYNVNRPAGVVPAEMIRINTAISGATCSPTPSRLGVLGGDACGFPNGRRLTDDIVEIELLAVAGAAYEVLDDRDATFTFDPALIPVLDDNVDANDAPFRNTFPYFATAQSGESHYHQNILKMYAPVIMKASYAAQTVSQVARQDPAATAATLGGATLFTLPALLRLRRRRQE